MNRCGLDCVIYQLGSEQRQYPQHEFIMDVLPLVRSERVEIGRDLRSWVLRVYEEFGYPA